MPKCYLRIAQSDRERDCIKYAICKASRILATRACTLNGFQYMNEHTTKVEKAMVEVQKVYETVEDIANVQDKALLKSFGILPESDSSDDEEIDENVPVKPPCLSPANIELCKSSLAECNYNVFGLIDALEAELGSDAETVANLFVHDFESYGFSKQQIDLILQSKEAYAAAKHDASDSKRTARALDGCVVADSEEKTSELFARASEPLCPATQLLIAKRRKRIQQQKRRIRAKAIVEGRILSRKRSSRISTMLSSCPDIGKTIGRLCIRP